VATTQGTLVVSILCVVGNIKNDWVHIHICLTKKNDCIDLYIAINTKSSMINENDENDENDKSDN